MRISLITTGQSRLTSPGVSVSPRLNSPIVNSPEVAILGVSRHAWKPVFREGSFVPRLMLPLSLSYDHRVIDGADAVRFTTRLKAVLADLDGFRGSRESV